MAQQRSSKEPKGSAKTSPRRRTASVKDLTARKAKRVVGGLTATTSSPTATIAEVKPTIPVLPGSTQALL